MKKFTFDATAVRLETGYPDLEKVSAWTDGLSISSEYEPGWPPAFRLFHGKKYRVTIEEIHE